MNRLLLLFIFLLSANLAFTKHIKKSFALNQIENPKQIIQDSRGQVYLLSDYKACAFGVNGTENVCRDFEQKIKELIIFEGEQSALAVDDQLQLYKNKQLQNEIFIGESIQAIAYFDKHVFIGTTNGLLLKYHIQNEKLDTLKSFEQAFINDLLVVDSVLWVAYDHGVAVFSAKDFTALTQISLPNKIVNRLLEAADYGVYAFTEFGDIYWYAANYDLLAHRKMKVKLIGASSHRSNSYLLAENACYELNEDLSLDLLQEGSFSAIYALNNQLLLADENSIHSLDVTQEAITAVQDCFSVFAEDNELLWVGSKGKVFLLEDDRIKMTINLPGKENESRSVSSIYVSDKYVFAGTMGEGLFVFNKSGEFEKQLLIEEDNNQKNIIQMQFNNQKLWVAYLNGVISLDVEKLQVIRNHSDIIGSNYLYSIKSIDEDEFLAGTSVHGLLYFKNNKLRELLADRSVFAIERSKDALYVSTENDGVYRISPASLKAEKISQQNKVFSIHSVGELLLLASENDLSLFDPKSNNKFDLPDIGLNKMQFNSTYSTDQYIFIGYSNGVLKIDKSKLKTLSNLSVYLYQPKLFNEEILSGDNEFSAKENTFTFHFQTYNYYRPENTFYKYRLLGLDSSWQLISQTYVNYYNLPSGEYNFQVAAGYAADFIPTDYAEFPFKIALPFWKKPIFIILFFLLLAGFVYAFIKWRESQILAKSKMERERLRFEFDQLKNQVDPHFLFNSLNSIIDLIEVEPEVAIDAVAKLSNTYRSILEYGKIDTVDLQTEIKLAEQYFQIHQLRYHDLIRLKIDNLDVDLGYRLLPLSLQFLIENAIKHNQIDKKHRLTIKIYKEQDYLVVENNIHAKKQTVASTALGIINLKKRYAQLSAKELVVLKSDDLFIVKLPLIYG